ncbi:hypothetical protein Enr10x_47040 [Gimesia panareensis]|uniref:Uncharacterized protein n=1 Tax=Gimesia panareensis TaxID=2527978 RepID=A0A517QCK7_9PLAN|nr:hypothetical protein [Gimesia panareensis]QDT29352.1 hypothetical protein Enr10x_47040 [Gimesia panareensis]
MNELRYTETQILCGMREMWERDQTELFFLPRSVPFQPDDRIDEHMQSRILKWASEAIDYSDLVDLYKSLQYCFRFECTREEWSDCFRLDVYLDDYEEWERLYAADFTFRRAAQFVAERATAISFEPVNIIGQECGPAGAFCGIQELVREVKKRPREFGPSTRIRDVLKGNAFIFFWMKVRWITKQRAPKLSSSWLKLETNVVFIMLACLLCIGAIVFSLQKDPLYFFYSAFAVIPFWILVGGLMERLLDPLPPELQTFRDLAVWMAELDDEQILPEGERG